MCVCVCVCADYVKGFGGKFGVQADRQDKSAVGWDHQEKLQLHESQKGKDRPQIQAIRPQTHGHSLSQFALEVFQVGG